MKECKHDWRAMLLPNGGMVGETFTYAIWYCTKCRLQEGFPTRAH